MGLKCLVYRVLKFPAVMTKWLNFDFKCHKSFQVDLNWNIFWTYCSRGACLVGKKERGRERKYKFLERYSRMCAEKLELSSNFWPIIVCIKRSPRQSAIFGCKLRCLSKKSRKSFAQDQTYLDTCIFSFIWLLKHDVWRIILYCWPQTDVQPLKAVN